jgi:hypothetical protein
MSGELLSPKSIAELLAHDGELGDEPNPSAEDLDSSDDASHHEQPDQPKAKQHEVAKDKTTLLPEQRRLAWLLLMVDMVGKYGVATLATFLTWAIFNAKINVPAPEIVGIVGMALASLSFTAEINTHVQLRKLETNRKYEAGLDDEFGRVRPIVWALLAVVGAIGAISYIHDITAPPSIDRVVAWADLLSLSLYLFMAAAADSQRVG